MIHERPFYPYRTPASDRLRAIVQDIENQMRTYESYYAIRKRKRKSSDQAIFDEMLTAVVCDLMHCYLTNPNASIHVSLSNRVLGRKSRYRAAALSRKLPNLLEALSSEILSFVEVSKGKRQLVRRINNVLDWEYRQTTVRPGHRLIFRIKKNSIDFSDFVTSDDEEKIILKGVKQGNGGKADKLEYHDTPETHRYRSDLSDINAFIGTADIAIAIKGGNVDSSNRRLRRIFNNGSFTQGGRLFGGFWQPLSGTERRDLISIDGEEVAELDYGQMFLRLLYAKAGAIPPPGDLYDIPDLDRATRDTDALRPGIKMVINAALFSDKSQTRMPKGVREHIPACISYPDLMAAISTHHEAVADLFFTGLGMELMFRESEIMVALLLTLKQRGIVALPIHDSVLVPRSSAPTVKGIMVEVFQRMSGIAAEVSVKEPVMNCSSSRYQINPAHPLPSPVIHLPHYDDHQASV